MTNLALATLYVQFVDTSSQDCLRTRVFNTAGALHISPLRGDAIGRSGPFSLPFPCGKEMRRCGERRMGGDWRAGGVRVRN